MPVFFQFLILNLKKVDESRQFEDVLDVVVQVFEYHLAASGFAALQDTDEDAQAA
jgi:hypothetical protein